MRSRMVLIAALALATALSACSSTSESERAARSSSQKSTGASQQSSATRETAAPPQQQPQPQQQSLAATARDEHGHNHSHSPDRVPAFQTDAASLKSLPPTLAPQMFAGKQRLAYQAVKEIPETIAQLPCYCHCDEGFGHKSLHSCFVDDHAAHCAVCVDEALVAYDLQKQERLTPEQIRARVIAQFSQ